MSYQVHITSTAEHDIMRAADYIEFTLKNPDAGKSAPCPGHKGSFPVSLRNTQRRARVHRWRAPCRKGDVFRYL